jgi:hypothetical protein
LGRGELKARGKESALATGGNEAGAANEAKDIRLANS